MRRKDAGGLDTAVCKAVTMQRHVPNHRRALATELACQLTIEFTYTGIAGPPPPPETKVTIVGNNEIYKRENLVGPFLVHKLLGPRPPTPPLFKLHLCENADKFG